MGAIACAPVHPGKRQSRGAFCPPASLRTEIVTQLRKLKFEFTATVGEKQQRGGAGGGIRRGVRPSVVRHERVQSGRRQGGREEWASTHKGLRPTACETVAFTDFATPAPFSAAKPSKSEDQDARLHTSRRTAQPMWWMSGGEPLSKSRVNGRKIASAWAPSTSPRGFPALKRGLGRGA